MSRTMAIENPFARRRAEAAMPESAPSPPARPLRAMTGYEEEALEQLAGFYLRKGEFERALQLASRHYEKRKSGQLQALLVSARAEHARGRIASAKSIADQAVREFPNDPHAHEWRHRDDADPRAECDRGRDERRRRAARVVRMGRRERSRP